MTELGKEAIGLAKTVLRLEKGGYIDSLGFNDDEELECEHLRRTAISHARRIQAFSHETEKAGK